MPELSLEGWTNESVENSRCQGAETEHMSVGSCKQLSLDGGPSGEWWEMRLERLARALVTRGQDMWTLSCRKNYGEREEWGHGKDISETLRSLSGPSQQTSSCLHDHRRTLSCLFHQTISISTWT